MSDFDEIRARIAEGRQAHQEHERSLQQYQADLKAVRSRLVELGRQGQADPQHDQGTALLQLEKTLQSRIAEKRGLLEGANAAVNEALLSLVALADPADLVERLDDNTPFLLLPVRLETRFMRSAQNQPELWVRIFPDDIFIDTHEEALTDVELQAGRAYWEAVWRSGEDVSRQQGAWRILVNASGQNRAAWIARALTPTNHDQAPGKALPADAPLNPPPAFPQPPARHSGWTLAPRARLMPDRFVVMLYNNGSLAHQAIGRAIPDPLVVGPDPAQAQDNFKQSGGNLQVDTAMKWMVDFQTALEAGMALRIPITTQEASQGFQRVLALGLRLSAEAGDSRLELEHLLDSHHYSDGFSLLPVGTPTNNTASAKSGHTSSQLESEDSFAVERGDPLFSLKTDDYEKSDGQRLAEALGIRYETLAHTAYSNRHENREAQAMNRALWAATLGYFMEEMMGPFGQEAEVPPLFSLATIQRTRWFFTRYVTGRGGLPSIRIGKQPYGILPTTVFSRFHWVTQSGPLMTHLGMQDRFMDALYQVLRKMDEHWSSLVPQVSRAGGSNDPEKETLDILGLHASSLEYYQRFGAGPDYWQNLGAFSGLMKQSQTFNYLLKVAAAMLMGELGFDFRYTPKIFNLTFFRNQTRLGALVQDDQLSEKDPLKPVTAALGNYIRWLAACKDDEQLRDQDFGLDAQGKPVPPPTALLYLLLRHSLLQQAWDAVMKVAVNGRIASLPDRREVELVNMRQQPDLTRWDYFQAPLPGGGAAMRIGRYLFSDQSAQLTEAEELREVRESLGVLADLPTARLERLAAEHLDLCSYRLDAWQSGLVTARLHAMRRNRGDEGTHDLPVGMVGEAMPDARKAAGIYLGAYGWLEDLLPGSARRRLEDERLPEEFHEPETPLYLNPSNQGYIHAPSLNHAASAAVLRSAYLTHASASNAGLMSVNLSSERVRRALWYLEGMRNGQELGALLGYQFERGLHDRNANLSIDQFILPIRRKYPLVADHVTPSDPGDSIEALEARNVVDGLKLLQASRNPGYPYGVSELPASGGIRTAIEAELSRMADAMDGLSDLALSESVYQAVQGNYERAGAMLKAISEGGRPYDEPEVVRTPRSGIALTHRMAILFDTSDSTTSPWGGTLTPRAKAELRLNRWLGLRLGAPGDMRCLARYTDPLNGTPQELEVSIANLALQPLDLLYLAPRDLADQATELEKRLAHHVRQAASLAEDVQIRLAFAERGAGWGTGVRSLFEVLPLLNHLRTLVAGSRPLAAVDLKPPADTPSDTDDPRRYDLLELRNRANALLQDVNTALAALGAAGTAPAMRNALLQAALLGIPDAVPMSATDPSAEALAALTEQVAAVTAELNARVARYNQSITASQAAGLKPPQQGDRLVDAIQALLGREFRLLPFFNAENASEVQLALAAAASLVSAGPPLVVEEWLDGLRRVRPKLDAYGWMTSLSDAFGNPPEALRVAQMPFKANDRWLALPLVPNQDLSREALSLAIQASPGYQSQNLQCGLLVDEWTEVIPMTEEITGLAVHFNQPNAEPPQSLLLVVPPELRGHWQWQDLVDSLHETLDMAKKRAVEPDLLGKTAYAQLLPAILSAVSVFPATISLDFAVSLKVANIQISRQGG